MGLTLKKNRFESFPIMAWVRSWDLTTPISSEKSHSTTRTSSAQNVDITRNNQSLSVLLRLTAQQDVSASIYTPMRSVHETTPDPSLCERKSATRLRFENIYCEVV